MATPTGQLQSRQNGKFWECQVWSGGPTDDQLGRAVFVFSALYGTDPVTVSGGNSKVAKCHGMVFGIVNTQGVPYTDEPGNRAMAAKTSTGGGQECKWVKTNVRAGYIFGWEDNFTFDKDTAEVRSC